MRRILVIFTLVLSFLSLAGAQRLPVEVRSAS